MELSKTIKYYTQEAKCAAIKGKDNASKAIEYIKHNATSYWYKLRSSDNKSGHNEEQPQIKNREYYSNLYNKQLIDELVNNKPTMRNCSIELDKYEMEYTKSISISNDEYN